MGDTFRKGCTGLQLVTGTAIAVPVALFAAGTAGAVLLVVVPCAALLLSLMMRSLLGGLTGDSYGAICEISEILSLFLFALLQ
jgi:adenosylcobinamide-GDP ribazoletransferase